ncbi:shell matrix protein-like [Ylistrum balloti]|uniref:shell matrix protein-like n=1 Tax=Ylistrum balloti TaxID=509963 RepID=UPI00290580E1|nr:shell matrix protein-like [Ylistrum balloti]
MSILDVISHALLWIFIKQLIVVSAQFDFFNRQQSFRNAVNRRTTTSKPCDLHADPNNRRVFLMNVNGEMRERPCAFGTLYSQRTCDCSDYDPDANLNGRRCRAPLYIPFNTEPIKDHGGTNIAMGNNGRVRVFDNVGNFNGNGAVTIWMYSGIDFGEHLGITLNFRDIITGGNSEQVLVSNCFYNSIGSVEIVIQPANQLVVFRVTTDKPSSAELSIPYKRQSWTTVAYTYNGNTLIGKVNNQVKSSNITGKIAVSPGSLRIGLCNGRGFVGNIDEFRLCQPILATLNDS